MEKEFEALEKIGAEKLARGELIRNDDKLEPYIAILKSALTELKQIKEAKPSKALEELNEIIEYITEDKKVKYKATILFDCEIIKDALLKAQEQEKVLEIIFEKNVDVKHFRNVLSLVKEFKYEDYAKSSAIWKQYSEKKLTKEEFDTLKRRAERLDNGKKENR